MTATEALRELLAALRACVTSEYGSADCAAIYWVKDWPFESKVAEEQRLHAALVAAQQCVEREG